MLTQLPEEAKAINDAQARQFPDHLQKSLWTHMGTLLSPFFRICGCCAVCSRVLQADTDHAANEAHMLCMTEAPAAREDVLALWAWLRSHLALGLMERWAADKGAQVCQSCVDHQSCMDGKCAHSFKNSEPVCLLHSLMKTRPSSGWAITIDKAEVVLIRSGSRSCRRAAGGHAVLLLASAPDEHWQAEGYDWNLAALL